MAEAVFSRQASREPRCCPRYPFCGYCQVKARAETRVTPTISVFCCSVVTASEVTSDLARPSLLSRRQTTVSCCFSSVAFLALLIPSLLCSFYALNLLSDPSILFSCMKFFSKPLIVCGAYFNAFKQLSLQLVESSLFYLK